VTAPVFPTFLNSSVSCVRNRVTDFVNVVLCGFRTYCNLCALKD
jgi:hypothetical protein